MFHYLKKRKVALAAVANSFVAERFDLTKSDWENCSYSPDKEIEIAFSSCYSKQVFLRYPQLTSTTKSLVNLHLELSKITRRFG